MRTKIEFTSFRHVQGYEIKDLDNLGTELGGDKSEPRRIVGRGSELHWYTFGQKHEALFSEFANVRIETDLLKFMNKYGPVTKAEKFGYEAVSEILKSAEELRSAAKKSKAKMLVSLKNVHCELVFDSGGGPLLRVEPKTLLQALWLQYGEAISNSQSANECRLCGKVFITGNRSTARRDSKFCCTDHRRKFNNDRRPRKRA